MEQVLNDQIQKHANIITGTATVYPYAYIQNLVFFYLYLGIEYYKLHVAADQGDTFVIRGNTVLACLKLRRINYKNLIWEKIDRSSIILTTN